MAVSNDVLLRSGDVARHVDFAHLNKPESDPSGSSTNRGTTRQRDDPYDDVAALFRMLSELPRGSPSYTRHRERIIERCLPLAEHVARRYNRRGEPHDDLVQVARVGLVNAVNRYDVHAGHSFVAFAVPTIMGEVRRYFRDSGWALRVPRRLKDLYPRITAAAAEFVQRNRRAPTASELARHLEVDREEVIEAMIAGQSYGTLSLDASLGVDEDSLPTLAERIGQPDTGFESVVDRETLKLLVAKLPERERTILAMRFFESLTQSQIADRLGISQMHVSRLLAKALATLREGFAESAE